MAALPARSPRPPRRRPRFGSLERPVDGRTYRGAWLLVAIPLLIAAFSVRTPEALPRPAVPAVFDREEAAGTAVELASRFPDRRAGSAGAQRAARWVEDRFRLLGFQPVSDRFRERVPGLGERRLENIVAVALGDSPGAILLMAHRDAQAGSPGASDNASGTAALLELARGYGDPPTVCPELPGEQRTCPAHTVVFLSSDGGALGGLGAERFAATSAYRNRIVAVVNLDSLADSRAPSIRFDGDSPRSASATLVRSAHLRLVERATVEPARPSLFRQLLTLGFPLSLYEHSPFVSRGIPAITLTTGGDRHAASFDDTPAEIDPNRLGQLGSAAQELVGSLDQGLEFTPETPSFIYLGSRVVPGWAVQLVLIGALLPFLIAAVDLFARTRRLRIPLAASWRSFRSRLAFWAFAGAVFGVFAFAGLWPNNGSGRPLAPDTAAAGDWPEIALGSLFALVLVGWLLARERLLPRRVVTGEEIVAGYATAMLCLAVVALLVAAVNAYALVFLLPCAHAWLWLPNLRRHAPVVRAAVFAAGFAGPLLLLVQLGARFDLGFDTFWYAATLVAVGYVPLPSVLTLLVWLAVAGQFAALSGGRYAPYPGARERPPRGPIRNVIRLLILALRRLRPPADVREEGRAESRP